MAEQEKQENGYDKNEYLKVFKKVNNYKKTAFLKFDNDQQEEFIKLFTIYNRNIIEEYQNDTPLEGCDEYNLNRSYYDKLKKKSYDGENDIKNLIKIREEYEKKARIDRLEKDNIELKEQLKFLLETIQVQNAEKKRSDVFISEVPDGGIDIRGKYENVCYVMQLKHTVNPEKYPVTPEQIRSFYGAYSKYYNGTQYIGIFLTNGRYTNDAILAEGKNCNDKIYLCTHENLYSVLKQINNLYINNDNSNNNNIMIENTDINNFSFEYSNITIRYEHVKKQVISINNRHNPYKRKDDN
ncbi:8825_t:CDS:2 [Cetraspora pellucida]|uniref:8825_t:CDS:1 n=1 Tax=Cetraspora pellucida TaxID=1433469 RepID=A0A9N8VFX3_9GLOM|nr:8825_t:CDS:2 [Cetraspora pellucida]